MTIQDISSINIINSIPDDYKKISLWLQENRQKIIQNPQIIIKIFEKLNTLLEQNENIISLRRDITLLLETIKIEYDALLKEYNKTLTCDKIIQIINDGTCDEFFKYCLINEKTFTFVEFLNIGYKDKEKKQKLQNKEIEITEKIINKVKPIDNDNNHFNDTTVFELNKIKTIVNQYVYISYYEIILDPHSFSKTIFNAFNISLAIKLKYIKLFKDKEIIFITNFNNNKICTNNTYEHGILEMTYEKYQQLLINTKITKSIL